MKRSALMARSPMKRGRGNPIPARVRAGVMERAGGYCEVASACRGMSVCYGPLDVHHLVKRPRLHEVWACLALCRRHHEMCEGPCRNGRLYLFPAWDGGACFQPWPDKVRASIAEWGPPTHIRWSIERRERKGAPLLELLASGVIRL